MELWALFSSKGRLSMQLSGFVAPRQMALQAVFVAPLKLVRQRRSVTPVARIVHEIQAGLVFARRWRDTTHLSRQVKQRYKHSLSRQWHAIVHKI